MARAEAADAEAASPMQVLDSFGSKSKSEKSSLKGDWGAICLLLLLYTLQGIPMGLSGSVRTCRLARTRSIAARHLATARR